MRKNFFLEKIYRYSLPCEKKMYSMSLEKMPENIVYWI